MKIKILSIILMNAFLISCVGSSSNNSTVINNSVNTTLNTTNSNNNDSSEPVLQATDLTLVVTMFKDGKLTLNNQEMGNIKDSSKLENELKSIFEERKKHGLYEKGNVVYIKAKNDSKYQDVVKLIDSVKKSDPKDIKIVTDN